MKVWRGGVLQLAAPDCTCTRRSVRRLRFEGFGSHLAPRIEVADGITEHTRRVGRDARERTRCILLFSRCGGISGLLRAMPDAAGGNFREIYQPGKINFPGVFPLIYVFCVFTGRARRRGSSLVAALGICSWLYSCTPSHFAWQRARESGRGSRAWSCDAHIAGTTHW